MNKKTGKISVFTVAAIALVLIAVLRTYSQSTLAPILYEELGNDLCTEYIAHDIDTFAIKLQNDPGSKGLIIFHGFAGEEGRNLTYLKAISGRIKTRGYDSDRLAIRRGSDRLKRGVEFWFIPENGVPPEFDPYVEKKSVLKATLFDRGWADWHNVDAVGWTIYSYDWLNWGCDLDFNMSDYAKLILADENLTGYLLIYNSKKQAKLVSNFALNELTEKYEVPAERLKVLIKPKQKEPQLELWLVPNGDLPPKP